MVFKDKINSAYFPYLESSVIVKLESELKFSLSSLKGIVDQISNSSLG